MKRYVKYLLSSTVMLLVVAFLVYHVVDNWSLLSNLSRFELHDIAVIVCFCLFQMMVTSLLIYLALGSLGVQTTVRNMFAVNAVTMLLNYTPMRLGTIFRAAYLKNKYQLGLSKFAALFMHTNLLIMLVATSVGLVALLIQFGVTNYSEAALALLFFVSAIGSIILLFAPVREPSGSGKISGILRTILQSRLLMASNRRVILICTGLLFAGFVTAAFRLHLVYASLSQTVHPLAILILGALGYLSMFVNITPGGLGVREAALAGGAFALNIDFEIGMLAAIIDRGIWLLTTLLAGSASLTVLFPDFRRIVKQI